MDYPIYLDLKGKSCFILGAGSVSLRKTKRLLESSARVTVASLEFLSGFEVLKKRYGRQLLLKKITKTTTLTPFLKGVVLAFACTTDSIRNKKLARLAQEKGILVNQSTGGITGDFVLPATWNKGQIQIAVGTSGLSPYLGRRLGERSGKLVRSEEVKFSNWLKKEKIRRQALTLLKSEKSRKELFQWLSSPRFIKLFKTQAKSEADTAFQKKIVLLQKKEEKI